MDTGPKRRLINDDGGAIEVRGLRKSYDSIDAVRGVDFEVAPGEIFGFLGPNGAGKSTTINILCTLVTPDAGTARVAGFDTIRQPLEVRRRIGLVFQDPTLDEYLTAEENLRFHAQLYGMNRASIPQRIALILEMIGLGDRRGSLVRTFSGGMKRRLEIARGLLHSPRVLFLDEPTIGLDPQTRLHVWTYIEELRRREDTTIFLTTHYMDEAEYCDRIAIIDNGEIVVSGTPSELKGLLAKDSIHLETENDEGAVATLQTKFGLPTTMQEGYVTTQVADGGRFVPRLLAELDVGVRSVRIDRPSLDDVFMAFTGHSIREMEATNGERMMAPEWRWRRGR